MRQPILCMETSTICCDGCAVVSCEELAMKASKKPDKLAKWIRRHVTLRRLWYVYFLSLVVFVVLSILSRNLDAYIFQIGTVFSIFIVYLVMIQSNFELRETTEKQVKAFVENLQTVCAELKRVSSGIDSLTNVMKDVQRAMLESTLVTKAVQERIESERQKRKVMMKPQLNISVTEHGFQFLVFDTKGYDLYVTNSGLGNAMSTFFSINAWRRGPFDIIANGPPITIDMGPLKDFKDVSFVDVQIQLSDIDGNFYRGHVRMSLPQPQPVLVHLIEL
ncbi:MAG TPA: hypothetical protein VMW36_01700 [Patescibacteria group bacterium]|nr:hypothetical protein [Patescibacteria group bacterium]